MGAGSGAVGEQHLSWTDMGEAMEAEGGVGTRNESRECLRGYQGRRSLPSDYGYPGKEPRPASLLVEGRGKKSGYSKREVPHAATMGKGIQDLG